MCIIFFKFLARIGGGYASLNQINYHKSSASYIPALQNNVYRGIPKSNEKYCSIKGPTYILADITRKSKYTNIKTFEYIMRITMNKWKHTLKCVVFNAWRKSIFRDSKIDGIRVHLFRQTLLDQKSTKLRVIAGWKLFIYERKLNKLYLSNKEFLKEKIKAEKVHQLELDTAEAVANGASKLISEWKNIDKKGKTY